MDFYVVGLIKNLKGKTVGVKSLNLNWVELYLSDFDLTETYVSTPNICKFNHSLGDLKDIMNEKDAKGKLVNKVVNVKTVTQNGVVLKANYKVDEYIGDVKINKSTNKKQKSIVHALYMMRGKDSETKKYPITCLLTYTEEKLYLYQPYDGETKFSEAKRSNWQVSKVDGSIEIFRNYGKTKIREFMYHCSNAYKIKTYKHGVLYLNTKGEYIFINCIERELYTGAYIDTEWLFYKPNITQLDVRHLTDWGLHRKRQRVALLENTGRNLKYGNIQTAVKLNSKYFKSFVSENNILSEKGFAVAETNITDCNNKTAHFVGCIDLNKLVIPTLVKYDDYKLNTLIDDSHVVKPVFNTCEGLEKGVRFTRPLIDYSSMFCVIPNAYIFTIDLRNKGEFYRRYTVSHIASVYFPDSGKVLDLKYYAICCHKSKTGNYNTVGFYKATGKNGKLANFMDAIDTKTGHIIKRIELNASNIDRVIENYIDSVYHLVGHVRSDMDTTYKIKSVMQKVKEMCQLDEAL